MPNRFSVRLSGRKELDQKLKAMASAIAVGLPGAAFACAGPIVTAMQDHAPPQIPDRDITAEIVSADEQHLEMHVSVKGSTSILTPDAQQTIMFAVEKEIEAALAAATDSLTNALTRVS